MKRLFDVYGGFVSRRPWIALALVLAITIVAIVGLSVTAPQADPEESFLPSGSELVAAQGALDESFPQFAALESIQVVLRGPVLTPGGVVDSLMTNRAVVETPELAPMLIDERPPVSIGGLVLAMVAGPGGDPRSVDPATLSQADIDAAIADPANAGLAETLESFIARDGDGAIVGGIGVIVVNAVGSEQEVVDAQLAADEAVQAVPLAAVDAARTFSPGKLTADSDAAAAFAVLMLVAFVVIGILLFVFYRQLSDVFLSLGGLILTIVWALGFQGLLGPDGLGVIGAPSVMAQMVPIILIGLCVDYGIQVTSRYRETVVEGEAAREGVSDAVSHVMLPLGLAGGTTIISFLTNLAGDIDGMADFGVVAGVGVASGLIVFLTGVPAARVLLDRRNEARGREPFSRLMNDAIPGAGPLVERLSAASVAKPGAILALTGVFTLVMAGLATQVESEFDQADFVTQGSDSAEDIRFIDEFLGGNTEPVTVLIESDVTSDRTLRNLLDLSEGLEDPVQKPDAVAGPVTSSLGVVASNLPLDAQAELNTLDFGADNPFVVESAVIEEALDIIEGADPAAFASVVAYGAGDDVDRMLVQFDAFSGDLEATRSLIEEVDGLWLGPDEEVTAISGQIIGLEVSDSLTESQGNSIVLTVLAALIVLVLFFWATEFRPMLAVLSVLPIGLVLVWVLGTMAILGYSYNVITAMITALSIGIGVDYTIHVTHRFLEEREHGSHTLAEALAKVMRTTGGALIGSALTTALGFLVLVFAPVPPMGQFGLLTAITVGYSLVAAIVVLPPMLVIWAAYHDWRAVHLGGLEIAVREEEE
ncbi:MAG: MMPL family transporter [Actinomycetota bacterium]